MSSCDVYRIDNTTKRIEVAFPSASYSIYWGENAPAHFVEALKQAFKGRKVAIIADENTAELFGVLYESMFITAGFDVVSFTIAAGETSKTFETAGALLEALAEAHFERGDLIVSLGGGVVSDLAGFVAAIYLRGVAFAQISTSLLSMVDASVGGKTGVDLPAGKNLAGAFKHPEAILMDSDVLRSLPESEYKSGLAEIAKSALLDGEEFVAFLSANSSRINEREGVTLTDVILRTIAFKASVVADDERESGKRACLNYGHTLGHALEKVLGYGAISHGEAIAQGMRFAARVSAQVLGADLEFVRRQDQLLDALGLPARSFEGGVLELAEAMQNDKKVDQGDIRMVLLTAPGTWQSVAVDKQIIFDHLNAWATQSKRG